MRNEILSFSFNFRNMDLEHKSSLILMNTSMQWENVQSCERRSGKVLETFYLDSLRTQRFRC